MIHLEFLIFDQFYNKHLNYEIKAFLFILNEYVFKEIVTVQHKMMVLTSDKFKINSKLHLDVSILIFFFL